MTINTDFSDENLNEFMQGLGARPLQDQAEYDELTTDLYSNLRTTDDNFQARNWWVFDQDLTLEGKQAKQLFVVPDHPRSFADVIIKGDLTLKDYGYLASRYQALIVTGDFYAPSMFFQEDFIHVQGSTRFDSVLCIEPSYCEKDIKNPTGPLCLRLCEASLVHEINKENLAVYVDPAGNGELESYGDCMSILSSEMAAIVKNEAFAGESLNEYLMSLYRESFNLGDQERERIIKGELQVIDSGQD